MYRQVADKDLFHQTHKYAMDYLDKVFDREVYPSEGSLAKLEAFDTAIPESRGDAAEIIKLLYENGSPNTVAQLGGRYFGFVNGSALPVTLAAKQLATFYDQNAGMTVISPLAAKLEEVVIRWLQTLFGLPTSTAAGFVSGTASANICGLAAARHRLLLNQGWNVNKKGLQGAPQLRVVASKDIHATIFKALAILGLGHDIIEWVDVDDQGRLMPEKLPQLDDRTIVILQAGNVNSGSFDPFDEVCDLAAKAGSWVHIDGAFGLWAQTSGELRHLTKGIAKAHSWSVDAHKTLNAPYDSGIAMCVDEEAMGSALHMTGAYIMSEGGREGLYFTPEMSRRARIIELWAALKYLGRAGIDELVYGLHQRAIQFAREIGTVHGLNVPNEVCFNQVLLHCSSDALTVRLMERVQQLGTCWVGGSSWKGRKVIRVSVCSWATTQDDITRTVASFDQALKMITS